MGEGPSDFDLWSAHRTTTWRPLLEALREAVRVWEGGGQLGDEWARRARGAIRDAEGKE